MSGGVYSHATQCGGKLPHRNKGQALAHVKNMVRRRRACAGELEVYRCPHCGRYHVGRRPGLNHALMTGGKPR